MDISKRNSSLDITRIVALFSVVSVHFFLNTGFYKYTVTGKRMLVMTIMRTACMICVPLFLTLTGYLMSRKTLSKKYYGGIVKTLGMYLLASAACIVFRVFWAKAAFPGDLFWGILNFKTAAYGGYIEMYIGLFLLIPFLNLMWNGLTSKKQKLALVATLIVLTSLPSMLNAYNFSVAGWWKTPVISAEYRDIFPKWWTGIYPLTYYFVGAFLREFPLKLKGWQKLAFWGGSILVFGLFNFYRSHGGIFVWAQYNDWKGLPNLIMTVFAFSFLSSINTGKYPNAVKRVLMYVSDLCLGAYLVSYIFDRMYYSVLNSHVKETIYKLEWFPVIVPCIFLSALALSAVLNLIYPETYRHIRKKITGSDFSADFLQSTRKFSH